MYRALIAVVAVSLLRIGAACGASATFDITVDAGRFDRQNVPVCVQLPHDQIGGEKIASAVLTDSTGKTLPAQITGPRLLSKEASELHFILPHLAAHETLRLTAILSTDPPGRGVGFAWHDHPGT